MVESDNQFTEAADVLVRRLRAVADEVEQTTRQFGQASRVGTFRPATHAAGFMLGRIAGVLQDHAPNLIARASEGDEALLESPDRIVVIDGRRFAVTAEEHRGDGSINTCLVPVAPEED